MFPAGQPTAARQNEGPSTGSFKDRWKQPCFFSVHDQRRDTVLGCSLGSFDLRRHSPCALETLGEAGALFDVLGDLGNQRHQSGGTIPPWVIGKQTIDVR